MPVHSVAWPVDFDYAAACLDKLSGAARDHFLPWGRVRRKPGDAASTLPGQAEVLRRIARDGARAFYEGEVAEDMLAALRQGGGAHDAADFAAQKGMQTDPISGAYKGATLHEHPPNGQGATAILMLNILGHFDLASLDPFGAERAHLEAEAAKLAYAARNRFIADAAQAEGDRMLDPALAADLAARIDPARALPRAPPSTAPRIATRSISPWSTATAWRFR